MEAVSGVRYFLARPPATQNFTGAEIATGDGGVKLVKFLPPADFRLDGLRPGRLDGSVGLDRWRNLQRVVTL
jgi:hypothetical protein